MPKQSFWIVRITEARYSDRISTPYLLSMSPMHCDGSLKGYIRRASISSDGVKCTDLGRAEADDGTIQMSDVIAMMGFIISNY